MKTTFSDQTTETLLPLPLIRGLRRYGRLHHGQRQVELDWDHVQSSRALQMTPKMIQDLLIFPGATYQLLLKDGDLHLGPVVGLLLGNQLYTYHDRSMDEFRDLMVGYRELGGLYIAMRYSSIDWKEECVFGQGYQASTKTWEYGKFPLPSVIYR